MFWLLAVGTVAICADAMDQADSSGALRGARHLQVKDSTNLFEPQCKPGYVDVTGGQAYYWSCAFYCEGGAYFSTPFCRCACQLPQTGGEQPVVTAPPSTTSAASYAPGGVIVRTATSSTAAPNAPVHEVPVGELDEWEYTPPSLGYGVQTPAPQHQAAPRNADNMDLMVLVLGIGGGIIAATCAVLVWVNLMGCPCLRRKRGNSIAKPPVLKMHSPQETCPQPLQVDPPSRRSSVSTGSSSRELRPGSSKQSSNTVFSEASGRQVRVSWKINAGNELPGGRLQLPASKNSCTSTSTRSASKGSCCSNASGGREGHWAFKGPSNQSPSELQDRPRKLSKVGLQ